MTSIVWLITAKCILNCPHCYDKVYINEKELTKDMKIRLAEEIGELGITHVSLSGGEPLLLEEIEDIIKILRDYNVDISIVTSGIVNDEYKIKILSKYDVYVYVSIDGDKVGHEIVRPGTWDRVMEFIEKLKKYNIEFGTSMALSKLNYDRVGYYIDTVVELEPSSICMIPVMPSGNALKNRIYVDVEDLRKVIEIVEDRVEKYSINIRFWCLPCIRAYTSNRRIIGGLCKQWDVIDITPGGRLVLCDIVNIELSRWVGGNLGEAIEKFRNSELYLKAKSVPAECYSCTFRDVCMGGCFSRSYIMYGDFCRKDPLCPI